MFFKGEDAIDSEAKRLAAVKAQRLNQPPLFWLKTGETKEVIMLDDDFISYYEHYMVEGNDWKNAVREMCIGDTSCPLCTHGVRRSLVSLLSLVDTSEWTDKQGNIHKNEKKIMKINNAQAINLKILKANLGGLKGKRLQITRPTDKDPNTGSAFIPMAKDGKVVSYDLVAQAAQGKDVSPLDYKKHFVQKTSEELKKLVMHKGVKVSTLNLDDDSSPSPKADDEDIPF